MDVGLELADMIAHKGVPLHDDRPPRKIFQQSFYTPASSVTNSQGLASGDNGEIHPIHRHKRFPPSVKVTDKHRTENRKSKGKGFVRSPHVQAVIERNSKRKSTESHSSTDRPIVRERWKSDPKEVEQLFDLFSKYDDILDHLAKKNRKLKSFVNGETKDYPINFSFSTIEILETLEKLKLQRESSFGLGAGLDVSARLRHLKQSHRSHSANPRAQRNQTSTSNTRYSEQSLRSKAATGDNYPAKWAKIRESRRSSSAPRLLRDFDRESSVSRRPTPPRFDRGSYGGHTGNRQRQEVKSRSRHGQDFLSLNKSQSNQSGGSNYRFLRRSHAKPDDSTYETLHYSKRNSSRGKETVKKATNSSRLGSLADSADARRHSFRQSRHDPDDVLHSSELILSASRKDSNDLPTNRVYTMKKSSIQRHTGLFGNIPSKRDSRFLGRYGEEPSDSERPMLTRREESESPVHEHNMNNRLRNKSVKLARQPDLSDTEDEIEVHRSSVPRKAALYGIKRENMPSSPRLRAYDHRESRNEVVTPPSSGRYTGKSTERTSPPRLQLKIWDSSVGQDGDTSDESDGSQHSASTPTKEPRKSFLPIAPTKRAEMEGQNGLSVSGSSYAKSLAPSEKARRLRSQVEQVYTSSQLLRETQEKLREDLVHIKDRYLEKNNALEKRISKAMHVDFLDEDDASLQSWDQIPVRSKTESFNIIEFQDGTIHLEDVPNIDIKSSLHDYHIQDGIIHVDDYYQESASALVKVIRVEDQSGQPEDITDTKYAEDSDLISMESEDESAMHYHRQNSSIRHGAQPGRAPQATGRDQNHRTRLKKNAISKPLKTSRGSKRLSGKDRSSGDVSIGTSTNFSIQNPLTIDESNSMIVQERPQKLGRDVGIREVVLRQNHVNKDTLRDIPDSLLNWSDSESVTNSSEKSAQHDNSEVPVDLKDTIDDLRSRPKPTLQTTGVVVPDALETDPNDTMLSSTKNVRWNNENQLAVQWHDHCSALPACGLASI